MKLLRPFQLCVSPSLWLWRYQLVRQPRNQKAQGLSGRYGSDDESEGRIIGREESKIDGN